MKRFELNLEGNLYIATANSMDELIKNKKVFRENRDSIIEVTEDLRERRAAEREKYVKKERQAIEKKAEAEKKEQDDMKKLFKQLSEIDLKKLLTDYKK